VKRERILAYAAFAVVCVVWGTTYLAIRIAIRTLPTLLFPGLRFGIAGLILLAITLMRGKRLPSRRADWLNLALIGFCMVGVGNVAVVWSEHYVSSGFAALLVATAPFWMAMLESLRRNGERLNIRKTAGMLIGFVGVGFLVLPELHGPEFNFHFLLGVLVLQLGSISWNFGSIRSKYHTSADVSPMISASLQMIFGGVFMSIAGLVAGESKSFHFTRETFFAFVYLTLFGSILAYGAYVYALSKLRTSTSSMYAYINPIVAVALGGIILNEPIGWNGVVGMLVIFSGVALVQMRRAPSAAPAADIALATEDASAA
jgi:drug/metabolite transporter (DMT)-like permease